MDAGGWLVWREWLEIINSQYHPEHGGKQGDGENTRQEILEVVFDYGSLKVMCESNDTLD